jgi:hypothetical protein
VTDWQPTETFSHDFPDGDPGPIWERIVIPVRGPRIGKQMRRLLEYYRPGQKVIGVVTMPFGIVATFKQADGSTQEVTFSLEPATTTPSCAEAKPSA